MDVVNSTSLPSESWGAPLNSPRQDSVIRIEMDVNDTSPLVENTAITEQQRDGDNDLHWSLVQFRKRDKVV